MFSVIFSQAPDAIEMKFFSYFLVLILNFCYLKTLVGCSNDEKCQDKRAQDNENSLKFFHSPVDADDVRKVSMTGLGLEAVNRATLESLDKTRTAILDLSINRISEIQNETFQSFQNLRILTLQINNLRHINSTTFGGLMMLEELNLSRNMISDIDRDAFRIMINLHTIDLSENCMFKLPNYLFFRNVRLINIYLKRNYLTALPILMPTQQFVENFNVSENVFTNITSFSQYNKIQSLDLSNNPLAAEEMATGSADVGKDSDSSDDSDERTNYNYLNVKHATDAKYTYNPSSSRSYSTSEMQANMFSGRFENRDRIIDFSPDANWMAMSPARINTASHGATGNSTYNRNLEYLMDNFRPRRMLEEALDSLIKTAIEKKSEDFKVTDMIQVFNTITNFYRSQNRQAFINEMEKIKKNDKDFNVASLVQFLQIEIKSQTRRRTRNTIQQRSQYSPEQLQQLIKAIRVNHLQYFTCRNCSLQSVDFLVKYPELKYVDISSNKIKTVNEELLGKALLNMRYLLVSDNSIASLNFTMLLEHWNDFRVFIANDNPTLNCDLIAQIQYKVAHLNKMFKLEVNKCK